MKEALFIWAAIQSLIFGILFLSATKKKSNRIMGLFFILISLDLYAQYLLRFQAYLVLHPKIIFISDILGFTTGPLLYLYVRQLWYQTFQKYFYFHFLPALLVGIFLYSFYFVFNRPFYYTNYIATWAHTIILFGIIISQLIYLTFYLREIRRHRFLKSEKAPLVGWLGLIFFVIIINTGRGVIFFVPNLFRNIYSTSQTTLQISITEYLYIALNTMIILMTTFWIIYDPGIFRSKRSFARFFLTPEDSSDDTKEENENKRHGFQIPKEEANILIEKLDKLNHSEKVYLRPDLNEKTLAEIIGVPTYYMSHLLNEHLNKTFTEYINTLRIERAKQMLREDKDSIMTNFAIALDCGYSTESTFYVNFKKITGMTPKQFKESINSAD